MLLFLFILLIFHILNELGTQRLLTLLLMRIQILKKHHIVAERALATQSIVFRHIDLRLEDLVIFIHDIGTLAYGFTKTIIEISFDDGHFEIR